MKLLVTGALRITPEESAELENLGYEIYFMPDERGAVPENIPLEKAVEMVMNNEIRDGKTQTAVLKVAQKRRKGEI